MIKQKNTPQESSKKILEQGSIHASQSKLFPLFLEAGFKHINSDAIHMTFEGYKSEIDHIFTIENLLIFCEETQAGDVTKHFPKKQHFHRRIHEKPLDFLEQYRLLNSDFDQHLINSGFEPDEYEIRSVYYSGNANFSENIQTENFPFVLLPPAFAEYFVELGNTISKSARFELYKFLEVKLSQLGDQKKSGQGTAHHSFKGHVLPSRHTSYDREISLVSFYVDPSSLIRRAYVLRREGWENSDVSYQRFVKREKLSEMRDYLANGGQVFLNNLIVTLPSSVIIRTTDGATLTPTSITELLPVELQLRDELGTIGIIDGQHRVLAYFEGSDEFESGVSRVRTRHNLLATGIILPPGLTADERVRFEADLFLRINSTQTPLTDTLKQALETLIHPDNPISITNLVLQQLAQSGPLAGLIQTTLAGSAGKVKTASFARYALLPLLDPAVKNNLYTYWSEKGNHLSSTTGRVAYIEFARKILNTMLGAMKDVLGKDWQPKSKSDEETGMLTPTSIGGAFFYMKNVIVSGIDPENIDFQKTFHTLTPEEFAPFTSSRWSACGKALYESHPPQSKTGS
ncbi:DGQHR domain-containing protein [Alcaligenes endophyticus]|uniref:DGQHR domain-containing protein n=1 Tax=Alcaligenes endophyticus TaxID=1929088 RepID=A0ABT8EIW5_9BURK|nr:DGQHR domain-containing protein [Alcaligenes endophyticus]MCX5592504.1 DGQHR domain-containing protein [Alcaligenes endophyticus]MDN4121229.1 DGQHR domain-containing protein [Alcaligenes endophyticus]